MLQKWLESYGPKELFGAEGKPNEAILSVIPEVRLESFCLYDILITTSLFRIMN